MIARDHRRPWWRRRWAVWSDGQVAWYWTRAGAVMAAAK